MGKRTEGEGGREGGREGVPECPNPELASLQLTRFNQLSKRIALSPIAIL